MIVQLSALKVSNYQGNYIWMKYVDTESSTALPSTDCRITALPHDMNVDLCCNLAGTYI